MKNILKILSLKNIKTIWDRFPISIIIIFIITGIFFILNHYENNFSWSAEKLIKINLSLIIAFLFSLWICLSTENYNLSKLKQNLFQIISIIYWIIFYNIFSFNPNDLKNILVFILSFSWIIAYLFIAPYFKKILNKKEKVENDIYFSYYYKLSTNIFITYIFANLLFFLGIIAIFSITKLFSLNINDTKIIWDWTILSLSLISPIFFLFNITKKEEYLNNSYVENKFFSFLIKFVLIPFIYIYFFILYTYSIKVLINFWNWPKWIISWIIIAFSILWYLIYIFSYKFENTNKAIKIFRKIFPYAVIPQVFMLFYAIYLRIAQYDLTVNRYFVVVFGLWLLVVSLHFIFSKNKNLIALPASLALFIIIISIIPKFNVYNYPEEKQLKRLETNLKKAWILHPEKPWTKWLAYITPLKNYSDISKDLSKNIYSWIDYLCDFNNCESIKNLFPKIYKEIEEKDKKQWEKRIKEEIKKLEKNKNKKECKYSKYWNALDYNCFDKKRLEKLKKEKYNWLNKWQIIDWITKKIKVDNYISLYFSKEIPSIQIYEWFYKIFPLDVSKYKEILKITSNIENRDTKYWEIDIYNKKLNIKEYNKILKTVELKNLFKDIIKKYDTKNQKNWWQEDYLFKINKDYDIILTNVNFPRNINDLEKKDDIWYYYFEWLLLVK